MDVMSGAYVPGDTQLVQQLVHELKSQGIFDQFRRECIADVDTKPAYQNLRQRVEGSVSNFLKGQQWSPGMNKNQVREQLRKNIYETGFLDTGVERIVDQVVNPKINTVFLPKVEDVVYKFLGVKRPDKEAKREVLEVSGLMPTDLEAVSPGSVHSFKAEEEEVVKKEDAASLDESVNSKVEDDESPPFEPLENNQDAPKPNVNAPEENSVDSYMSGFSGLQSHDSNNASDKKPNWPGQESQSCNGSDTQFSTVTSDETKMEICEDSNSKPEEPKKVEGEAKTEADGNEHKEEPKKETEIVDEKKSDGDRKSRSSHSSSSKDKKDSKHRKEHNRSSSRSEREGDKSKHNSSSSSRSKHHSSSSNTKDKDKPKQDKERDKDKHKKKSSKDSDRPKEEKERKDKDKSTMEKEKSKEKSKSDKDREKSRKDKDKPKEKSEKDRDKSSSKNEDKEKSFSKSEDKEKSHRKNDDKDKSSSKDDRDKNKSKDSSRHKSSSNSKHSSRDKDRSSSSSSKKKDDSSHKSKSGKDHKHDPKKSTKDDHYSFKDKNGSRRSFDRDSNDGSSSNKPKHKTDSFSEPPKSVQKSSTTSSSFYGSGESGNSDHAGDQASDGQRLKLLKPKFASNFEEARKLMRIRKHLTMLERHNKLSLTQIDNVSGEQKEVKVEEGLKEVKVEESIQEVKSEENLEDAELRTPQIANVSKENWEALEAKLALEMSKTVNCSPYESHYDVPDEGTAHQEDAKEEKGKAPACTTEVADVCDIKKEDKVETEAPPASVAETNGDVVEEKIVDVVAKDQNENGKLPHDIIEKQNVLEVETKSMIELEVETKTSQQEEPVDERCSPARKEPEEIGDSLKNQQMDTENHPEDKGDDSSDDERCRYLEMPTPEMYKRLKFLKDYVAKLQADMEPPLNNVSPPSKRGKKRSNENVDMTNNNKEEKPEKRLRRKANSTGNKLNRTPSTEVSLDQNFFLPDLSLAEGDKPPGKKEIVLSTPPSQQKRPRGQSKRQQHYNSEDLYKPRPTIGLRRSRGSTNNT